MNLQQFLPKKWRLYLQEKKKQTQLVTLARRVFKKIRNAIIQKQTINGSVPLQVVEEILGKFGKPQTFEEVEGKRNLRLDIANFFFIEVVLSKNNHLDDLQLVRKSDGETLWDINVYGAQHVAL